MFCSTFQYNSPEWKDTDNHKRVKHTLFSFFLQESLTFGQLEAERSGLDLSDDVLKTTYYSKLARS